MAIAIGEAMFNHFGAPRLLAASEDGHVVAEDDMDKVGQAVRHGYLKGLSPEMRARFETIVDEAATLEEGEGKVALLQERIAQLDGEAAPGTRQLLGYLKAQLAHYMHAFQVRPRVFELPEGTVDAQGSAHALLARRG